MFKRLLFAAMVALFAATWSRPRTVSRERSRAGGTFSRNSRKGSNRPAARSSTWSTCLYAL